MPKTAKLDSEIKVFAADVLESIRQAKRGEGKVHRVTLSAAAEARAKVGMSQSQFAALMGVTIRTLQNWERGRTQPSDAAKTLLRIAVRSPDVVRMAGIEPAFGQNLSQPAPLLDFAKSSGLKKL